ncbi:tRNA (cytosine34-C5)-methyltransferase [Trypanosoma theileri]|uniref:tRNA (Cytosine34-C5)-methyltransferase n=1 Tax=Trypanosoma theileri TaxID=67003 RepID=A0A1X0NUF8_9TRYP|nr:tRNA (cytosine34-C5)-methyltransferase [Trypanosoma theileri]ORC87740.1 tRNA (cytosine34-C5)-methyltransferase [Trypanosoma theileri]
MRSCPIFRYDSFTSFRSDLKPLFSSLKTVESVRQAVRRHVCDVPRRYKETSSQRASWIRGNISLLFEEARKHGSYTVARAAVEVILEHQQQLIMEPAWVKNALAACRSTEEIREMELLLQKQQQQRLGVGSEEGMMTSPMALTNSSEDILPPALMEEEDEGNDNSDNNNNNNNNNALMAAGYSGSTLAAMRYRRDDLVTAPNVSFSRYFTHQGIVVNDAEVMQLFKAMRGRQPVAFRVHTSQMYGPAVTSLLHEREGIKPLSYLPSMCGAFTMLDTPDTPHSVLLSNRQLLRSLSNERLISFQSTSSMLPVILLDPQPGESVLDMCASPGSKTSLIIDYTSALSLQCEQSTLKNIGCVVANDAISSRSRPLAQRLQSFSPAIAVTQLQGQSFPTQSITTGGVRYDKVLVDAPCSGEGRMQRDAISWRMWHPLKAVEFFPSQVALLRRAVELCAAGGRIVYATCTLNPLENEAVLATVLADGEVELIRPPRSLIENKDWKFSRGLRRWSVPSRAGGFLHSFEEGKAKGEAVRRELFPREDCEALQTSLESCCLRVLPHLNNGAEGFFFAALRKVRQNSKSFTSQTLRIEEKANLHSNSNLIKNNKQNNHLLPFSTDSILHTHGLVRLAGGNMLLQRHLSCFFNNNTSEVEKFLTRHNLCAAWRENQGLLLVSESTWSHLKAIPSSSSTSLSSLSLSSHSSSSSSSFPSSTNDALLEIGVTVINATTGQLTESGAFHLRPHATSRVLQLPLSELQWLLSHQLLKVTELQEDPNELARRIVAGTIPANQTGKRLERQTPLPWVAQLLHTIGQDEGNFIVSCLPSSIHMDKNESHDLNALTSISIPVTVQKSTVVELRLSLSHSARQRCMAVIGRLIAHAKRPHAATSERKHMQMSAEYNVSAKMESAKLEGRPLTVQQQERKLFSSSSSSSSLLLGTTTTTTTTTVGEIHQRKQESKEEKQRYFEI